MKQGLWKPQSYVLMVGMLCSVGVVLEVCPAVCWGGTEHEGKHQPTISVQVYNYAQIPSEVLAKAQIAAGEIFHAAGVEIAWTNCELPKDSHCADYLDAVHLGVRLLPDIGVAPGTTKRTMGLAVGDLASISYRCVQEDAADFGVKIETVLGPTMAHEIGHLLLVSEGHSPSGIMRELWRREDYERAPRGAFKFTSKQARTIGTEVRERAERQARMGLASRTDPR